MDFLDAFIERLAREGKIEISQSDLLAIISGFDIEPENVTEEVLDQLFDLIMLSNALNKKLSDSKVTLSIADCVYVLCRFGVKTAEEIDDDFIKIVLSITAKPEESKEPELVTTAESNPIPKVKQHTDKLAEIIRLKAESEASKLSEAIANVPLIVRQKLLKDIQEREANEDKQETLLGLKRIVDFSVVYTTDQIESRRLLTCVLGGLMLVFAITIFSGMYDQQNEPKTNQPTIEVKEKSQY
jgi:hypothetical protein